ncbi:MAG: hypothetical protein LAO06_20335 [Acidobacteriia bacterium]|nr:hypothetical protein [Terriglobia bacterium]
MKAVIVSIVVTLLASGMPAQQNPTANWQSLRDSARMHPVQPGETPKQPTAVDYPVLLEQSRAATTTLNQSMAGLDRCTSCSDVEFNRARQAADEAGRAFSAAWLQTNAALISALHGRVDEARAGAGRFVEQRDRLATELGRAQSQVDRLQQDIQQANARALGILRSNMNAVDKAAQLDGINADITIRQRAMDSVLNSIRQWQRLLDTNAPSVARSEQYIADLERRMMAAEQENMNIRGVEIALQFYLQAKDMDRNIRVQMNLPEPPAPAFAGLAFVASDTTSDPDSHAKTTRDFEKSTEERMRKLEDCTKRRSFQVCAAEYPSVAMR